MWQAETAVGPTADRSQDELRPVRMFVSLLSGALANDQTYAEEDNGVGTRPGQYQTVTPFGVSVEGRPVSNLQNAAVTMPIGLIALGVAAFFFLKK